MKRVNLFLILISIFIGKVISQNVGINGTGGNAHPSALLDIDAVATPSLGILIPRIALQAVNVASPVTSPVTSLLVYNTVSASSGTNAVVPGYYYWDGIKWLRIANGTTSLDNQSLSLTGSTLTISNGNSVNLIGTTGFTHYIGEVFGGGVISHLWKDNMGIEHGVITSTVDIAPTAVWGCDGTILAGAQSSWNGAANTASIVAWCVPVTAAHQCDTYTGGGFTDWYLPSLNELQSLYINLAEVNRSIQNVGGVMIDYQPGSKFYWSSTEYDSNFALGLNFFNYITGPTYKTTAWYVRAVRAF